MAICDYCEQEMTLDTTISCIESKIIYQDGLKYSPIPFEGYGTEEEIIAWFREVDKELTREGEEHRSFEEWHEFFIASGRYKHCSDCGVAKNGFHHPGCDAEECPRCGGQLISCGCLKKE